MDSSFTFPYVFVHESPDIGHFTYFFHSYCPISPRYWTLHLLISLLLSNIARILDTSLTFFTPTVQNSSDIGQLTYFFHSYCPISPRYWTTHLLFSLLLSNIAPILDNSPTSFTPNVQYSHDIGQLTYFFHS